MKLLASGDLANGALVANIDNGQFRRLMFVFTGTNNASQAVAAAAFGNIQLTKRGDTLINVDFDDLQSINNLKGGAVDAESASGGAFSFTGILDFFMPGDNMNVLSIEKADGCTLEIAFDSSTITTDVSSGICQVYGIEAEGVQAYELNLHKFDMPVQAGDIPFSLPANNVIEWLVENDSTLSKLLVKQDNDTRFNGSKTALLDLTHYVNKVETYNASLPFLDLDLLPTGNLQSSLADSITAIVTATGSATINSYVFHVSFNLADYQRSTAISQSQIAQKVVNTKSTNAEAKAVISTISQPVSAKDQLIAERTARAEAKYGA